MRRGRSIGWQAEILRLWLARPALCHYTAPDMSNAKNSGAKPRNGKGRAKELPLLKRFERHIDRAYGFDFSTPRALRRARWHFNWVDHAAYRRLWPNLAFVAKGLWRSSHPTEKSLAWLQTKGVVSVLNLRGAHTRSHYYFEKQACDKLGLDLVNISLSARNLVSAKVMLRLLDIFETIDRPFVLHCKSGADRAGLASALYLIHIEGRPVSEARTQLSPRFLHFRFTSTGILDFLLDAYEKDVSDTPMTLRQWFETRYDPQALSDGFAAKRGKPRPRRGPGS